MKWICPECLNEWEGSFDHCNICGNKGLSYEEQEDEEPEKGEEK